MSRRLGGPWRVGLAEGLALGRRQEALEFSVFARGAAFELRHVVAATAVVGAAPLGVAQRAPGLVEQGVGLARPALVRQITRLAVTRSVRLFDLRCGGVGGHAQRLVVVHEGLGRGAEIGAARPTGAVCHAGDALGGALAGDAEPLGSLEDGLLFLGGQLAVSEGSLNEDAELLEVLLFQAPRDLRQIGAALFDQGAADQIL